MYSFSEHCLGPTLTYSPITQTTFVSRFLLSSWFSHLVNIFSPFVYYFSLVQPFPVFSKAFYFLVTCFPPCLRSFKFFLYLFFINCFLSVIYPLLSWWSPYVTSFFFVCFFIIIIVIFLSFQSSLLFSFLLSSLSPFFKFPSFKLFFNLLFIISFLSHFPQLFYGYIGFFVTSQVFPSFVYFLSSW